MRPRVRLRGHAHRVSICREGKARVNGDVMAVRLVAAPRLPLLDS
ncbi:hypothetical protein YT1_0471 [Rhodococcus ruber]|nr:hypothetical protein YT1_0471 [Rhodococcus ruber]